MAGGAGERFWPRSRRAYPKPLMRVLGSHSLLEAALARARRFAGHARVWIVCTRENAAAIRAASGLPRARILIEPHGRNTAMAVGFAAARVAAVDAEDWALLQHTGIPTVQVQNATPPDQVAPAAPPAMNGMPPGGTPTPMPMTPGKG